MENNDIANLDLEFKRYLQLLRPYLGQLVDKNVIRICDSWIQRLSDCKENEKSLRNKYIFVLCYQLARGVLDMPFLKLPPAELAPLSEDVISEESMTEVEYLVNNSEEPKTKMLFNRKTLNTSETDYLSQDFDRGTESLTSNELIVQPEEPPQYQSPFNKNVLCYTCPETLHTDTKKREEYEFRANNVVNKLRQIKTQNILLQRELMDLREECKNKSDDFVCECIKNNENVAFSYLKSNESSATLRTLKNQLQEVQDSRNGMIQTISNMHEQINYLHEMKKNEIEEIEAKHKLELIAVRNNAREETKAFYEAKITELKQTYEETVNKMQESTSNEQNDLLKLKNDTIAEKTKLLDIKDAEILRLRNQIDDQKNNLHAILNKIIERSNENLSNDTMKLRTQQLEKRLNKLEKSKAKCIKVYETKLAQLQQEKHLAECSLQLQIVRQRAQVVTEMTEENQAELTTSLDKLENKYKDIVANVQATAIKRRVQDQLALESIFQAACSIQEPQTIVNQKFPKPTRNHNQSFESEISSLMRGNKVGNVIVANKSLGEDSLVAGYCLNGERMGELFERVYIPQRDNGDTK